MDGRAPERTSLLAVLTAATLAAGVAMLVWRARLLVPLWVVLALGVPGLVFSSYLRLHRDDAIGRERRYLDWWSIPHLAGGALLGMLDLGGLWVAALVVWWEGVEIISRVFEHATNRLTDVVLALVGWAAAQLVITGALRMT